MTGILLIATLVYVTVQQHVVVNADYDYETRASFVFTARATDLDTMLFKERNFTVSIRDALNEPLIEMSVVEKYRCQGE